jgi:hypothetical protein
VPSQNTNYKSRRIEMKLNYKVREIFYQGKKDDIVFDFEKKYELLTTFLSADVKPFSIYIIKALDNLLDGKSEYEEISGNVCGVKMHKEKTQIYDNLSEDGMGNWCEVDTKDLRELIEIWSNKLKKFEKENL